MCKEAEAAESQPLFLENAVTICTLLRKVNNLARSSVLFLALPRQYPLFRDRFVSQAAQTNSSNIAARLMTCWAARL